LIWIEFGIFLVDLDYLVGEEGLFVEWCLLDGFIERGQYKFDIVFQTHQLIILNYN